MRDISQSKLDFPAFIKALSAWHKPGDAPPILPPKEFMPSKSLTEALETMVKLQK